MNAALPLTYWTHVGRDDRRATIHGLPLNIQLRGRGKPNLYLNTTCTAALVVRVGRFGFLTFTRIGLWTEADTEAALAEFPASAPRVSNTGVQKPKTPPHRAR